MEENIVDSFSQNIILHDRRDLNINNNENSSQNIRKRNTWNEKKNSILIEIVKNSRYPTPWRPKHGTNKEIWEDIAGAISARSDIFDAPIQWESAKEQLMKIIDR